MTPEGYPLAPQSPPSLAPGMVLGQRFRIELLLGTGGMGEVYRAQDTKLHRTVALKVLSAGPIANPSRKGLLLQEARAASALNHPHIATVYDLAAADGVDFIAMEYVPGPTLDAVMPREGFPIGTAVNLAIQIASAVECAHSAGLVHRDLKPGNVMIAENGSAKVLDFGLAKLVEPSGRTAAADLTSLDALAAAKREEVLTMLTQSIAGVIVGTAAYMSPEQAAGGAVDARSDIFSFGAVLYEMLTGRRAFAAASPLATLVSIVHDRPRPIRESHPHVPAALERVVTGCLEKQPDRRYQSMAEVQALLESVKAQIDSEGRTKGISPRRRGTGRLIAGLAVLAVVLAAAGWWLASREAPLPAPRTIPLTSFPGEEYDPAVSPDGKQVAFVWNGPRRDNHDIYTKLVHTGAPLRLTQDPAVDSAPAWSPDGEFIAFYRESAKGREVRIVPALGGPERVAGMSRGRTEVSTLAWAPDGKSLIIVDQAAPDQPVGIAALSIDTGAKRVLTTPVPGQFPGDARFALSPDGRRLAFLRIRGSLFGRDIHLLELDPAGAPKEDAKLLVSTDKWISGLDWSREGRSIIVSSDRGGNQRLWRVRLGSFRRTPALEPLAAVGENATTLSVSRGSPVLAYTRFVYDINVYRLTGSVTAVPERFVASTREDRMARYSPDGSRIAFISDRSGYRELWVSDSEGLNSVQLTQFEGAGVLNPAWSPDASYVAFAANPQGSWDIFRVRSTGGAVEQLTRDASDDSLPAWSRNGAFLYFASNREDTREIWKMPAAGGPAKRVTRGGGNQSAESPDGRTVYYTKGSQPGLWAVAAEGGDGTLVLDAGETHHWALGPGGVYVLDANAKPAPTITVYSLPEGRPRRLFTLPEGSRVRDLAVSPDGRVLLFSQAEQLESDIMLVDEFR